MNDATNITRPEIVLWSGPEHNELLAEVIALLGDEVQVLAVGGPRHANVAKLARRLGHEPADDLRATLVQHPPALLVLGTQTGVGLGELLATIEQDTRVASLAPAGGCMADLAQLQARAHRDERGLERLDRQYQQLGALTRSPGFDAASSAREMLGPARVIQASWTGPAAVATLAARLFDLWYTLLAMTELPDRVSAAFTGQAIDDSDLGRLQGSFAVVAHTPQAPIIHLLASDQSGHDTRLLQIWSPAGHLRVEPDGFEHRDSDGQLLDQARGLLPDASMAHQMAGQLRQMIARRPGAPMAAMARTHHALACALACQLSARTGQGESPRRLLSMANV